MKDSFSRIGAHIWNGLPAGIHTQPKLQKQLMQVLIKEDTYVDTPTLTKIFCKYQINSCLSIYYFVIGLSL